MLKICFFSAITGIVIGNLIALSPQKFQDKIMILQKIQSNLLPNYVWIHINKYDVDLNVSGIIPHY